MDPIPVDEIGARRRKLISTERASHSMYDPRPLNFKQQDPEALEKLRCDLINLPEKTAFIDIIVPCTLSINKDHCYTKNITEKPDDYNFYNESSLAQSVCPYTCDEIHKKSELIIQSLTLTESQIENLERLTREQSSNDLWHKARKNRITGSKCGRIIKQKDHTTSLLRSCIYPKPFIFLPKPIEWGRRYEEHACREYCKYMHLNGHSDLKAKKSGFVVHSLKGWLGASPDAWVEDPTVSPCKGIAEFKCPYSKAKVDPKEACNDPSFYCTLMNEKMFLDRHHPYYHQVQLQLYVCGEKAAFCDFCIFTLKGC